VTEFQLAGEPALAVETEPAIDLRSRVCGTCAQPMSRIEFYDDAGAPEPRVMWSCDDCGSWTA